METPIDMNDVWFQPDDATYNISHGTIDLLRLTFYGCLMSQNCDVNWPMSKKLLWAPLRKNIMSSNQSQWSICSPPFVLPLSSYNAIQELIRSNEVL